MQYYSYKPEFEYKPESDHPNLHMTIDNQTLTKQLDCIAFKIIIKNLIPREVIELRLLLSSGK